MTATVASLLSLERTAETLDRAELEPTPEHCHRAAEELAGQLNDLAPDRLGKTLGWEIRRWIDYLGELAHRTGVDTQKVDRLRSLLEQLERRLQDDWDAYFQRLTQDPWLSAYNRGSVDSGEEYRLGPVAWAILGPEGSARRLAQWREALAPLRTASETGLRLMRDALHRQTVDCPPQGYLLDLPSAPASGLVQVAGLEGHIPQIQWAETGGRLRFRQPEDLSPASDTVQTTLGWFTL